ncbi:GNAT family N-acetyltransferase [Aestuariimicrobium soli]|uniref:GNAT family N-acetyltransferase n=1 Tax=Aestuariimicrobium soli TaxID=2035834 RepID=UPI003EB724C5
MTTIVGQMGHWPIVTERLQVRPYEPVDLAAMWAFESDPRVQQRLGWSPSSPFELASALDPATGSNLHLVVLHGGAVVGHVMVMPRDGWARAGAPEHTRVTTDGVEAELGWMFAPWDLTFTARAADEQPPAWAPATDGWEQASEASDRVYDRWYRAAVWSRIRWLQLVADGGLDVIVPDPDPAWTNNRRRVLVDLLGVGPTPRTLVTALFGAALDWPDLTNNLPCCCTAKHGHNSVQPIRLSWDRAPASLVRACCGRTTPRRRRPRPS